MRTPKLFKTKAATFSYQHGVDLAKHNLIVAKFIKKRMDEKDDATIDLYIQKLHPELSRKRQIGQRSLIKERVNNINEFPKKSYKIEKGTLWIFELDGTFSPFK